MSIIDTLVQYGDQSAQFTVNTAVDFVGIVNPVVGVLSVGGVFNTFQWRDKLNLLSLAVLLPLGFEFYPTRRVPQDDPWPNSVGLKWRRVFDGAETTWAPSTYNMIAANYEISIGAYLEPPDAVISDYNLVALLPSSGSVQTNISMINVPAGLDEKIFACPIFAKIEHTLPMI